MQKKFHFASHDHSKYDYLKRIIISVLPTRNPIKEYHRNIQKGTTFSGNFKKQPN